MYSNRNYISCLEVSKWLVDYPSMAYVEHTLPTHSFAANGVSCAARLSILNPSNPSPINLRYITYYMHELL